MRTLLALCVLALGSGLGPSAYAHHSMAGFERNKTVTLNGTVKQFKWANPHSWIELEVPNDKGAVDIWNVEMTAPAVLVRAGWKSTTLKPGDKVSIAAHPLMTGEPGGIFVSVTLASGQTLTDKPALNLASPTNP
jgi:hypothetical protein